VDRQYRDGTFADVLDIVTVLMEAPRPQGHHREDHQIQTGHCWEKLGRATWQQVAEATDIVHGSLWPNEESSFHGVHDKVSAATAAQQLGSLLLISPTRLHLVVGMESQYLGPDRRRVRARFEFNGQEYNFVVTDPWIEGMYFAGDNGTFRIDSSCLCISLPEVIGGHSTKLVAAVITPERAA
jgi:Dual OB-containing domain